MPYPGGALIEKHANAARERGKFPFPHGDAIKREPRFSFSGLKTSLRYRLEKISDEELSEVLPDICADYQDAIIRQLVPRLRRMPRSLQKLLLIPVVKKATMDRTLSSMMQQKAC